MCSALNAESFQRVDAPNLSSSISMDYTSSIPYPTGNRGNVAVPYFEGQTWSNLRLLAMLQFLLQSKPGWNAVCMQYCCEKILGLRGTKSVILLITLTALAAGAGGRMLTKESRTGSRSHGWEMGRPRSPAPARFSRGRGFRRLKLQCGMKEF